MLVLASLAGSAARADDAALEAMVTSERAFAALSVAKGMKEAFLTYLSTEGVVFQPTAVNGRKLWEGRPASAATLRWEPTYAAIASSGDLGYTTGPWEYRPPADSAGTPAPPESYVHGQFNSVWRKEKRAGWRVIADIGVTHPRPTRGGVGSGEFATGPTLKLRTMKSGRPDLPGEDEQLSKAMRAVGAREALAAHGAPDLRLNTEGRFPALGLDVAQARLDSIGGFYAYTPQGSEVSRAGDLGYTYGTAERFVSKSGAPADTSVYLHVWRQESGRLWRLVLAVINPLPKR